MRLGTRLLIPVVVTVTLVMCAYGVWAARVREQSLLAEAYRETRAYSTALGIGLEYAFSDTNLDDVREIVERVSREPKIYGVIVYTPDQRVLYVSAPLTEADATRGAELARVLRTGGEAGFSRVLRGQDIYSILRPIRDRDSRIAGAFEVVQPLTFVETELAGQRFRLALVIVLLISTVTGVLLLLVRRLVARPLDSFVGAVRALGRGELGHRLEDTQRTAELAELTSEFNRMADHLQGARLQVVREGQQRVTLERQLRESEKMAAVGGLSAALAHEIAAPLSVVGGRAEMLLRDEDPASRKGRNLRIIVDQIGRIALIVRNLLNYARRRDPQFADVQIQDIVGVVLELLETEFERAGVTVSRAGPPRAIHGDAELLQQVFINLLLNALQAVEKTDHLREISIRVHEPRTPEEEASAVIDIEDSGPGVAADVADHVFDPFFTTKRAGEGTGLGLAVARSIVEEHGGSLEVVPDRAAGACFRVTLPAAETMSCV